MLDSTDCLAWTFIKRCCSPFIIIKKRKENTCLVNEFNLNATAEHPKKMEAN